MRREFVKFANNLPLIAEYKNIQEYPIHWHASMEIIYVIKGSINITIETETHRLWEGQIEIVNSDEAHSIFSEDKDNEVLIFSIDINFLNQYYNLENIFFYTESSGKYDQRSEKYERLRGLLAILLWEYANTRKDYEDRIENTLVELLYHLINNFHYLLYEEEGLKDNETQFERYDRVIKYIYYNYNNKISLQDIARREYLSSHYLSNGIKNTVGYSFNDFVNLTRVEEAIKFLLDTDKTISEISEDLGFSHTRYFNKHFKKHYNCTPMQYRKKHKVSPKKYEESKRFKSIPIEEGIESISEYLENYQSLRYHNNIVKLNVDLTESFSEPMGKVCPQNLYIGDYRRLLIGDTRDLLKEIKRELGISYGIIDGLFKRDLDETDFIKTQEIHEALGFITEIGIIPNIVILQGEKSAEEIVYDFTKFKKCCTDFFDASDFKKWKFSIYEDLDKGFKDEIQSEFKDKFDIELIEVRRPAKTSKAVNDTAFMIPSIASNALLNKASIEYIKLFDDISSEEDNEVFNGGEGVINSWGIKKPSYYAYFFLSRLGGNIVSIGEGYAITEEDFNYKILLYSPEININNFTSKEYLNRVNREMSGEKFKFSINLGGLSEDYRVVSYKISNKTGSSYDNYLAMGSPDVMRREDVELLKSSSNLNIGISYGRKTPVFNIVTEINGVGATLIELQKVQKHP